MKQIRNINQKKYYKNLTLKDIIKFKIFKITKKLIMHSLIEIFFIL